MKRYTLLSLALASTLAAVSGCSRVANDSEMPYKPTALNNSTSANMDTTAPDTEFDEPITVQKPIVSGPAESAPALENAYPATLPAGTVDNVPPVDLDPAATEPSLTEQPIGELTPPPLADDANKLEVKVKDEPKDSIIPTEIDVDVDGVDQSVDKLDRTKEEFIDDTESQLKKLDAKYAHLKQRAADLSEETREDINDKLKIIEQEREDLTKLLTELRESTGDSWADMQKGIVDAWNNLKISTDKTEETFRLELGDLKIDVDEDGLNINVNDGTSENKGATLKEIVDSAEEVAKEAINEAGEAAESTVNEAQKTADEVLDDASEIATDTKDAIDETADDAADAADETAGDVKEATNEAADDATDAAEEVTDEAEEAADKAAEETEEVIDDATEAAADAVDEAEEAVDDVEVEVKTEDSN